MKMVFFLHEGVTSLDIIGPYQMLSAIPHAKVQFAAKTKGIIQDDMGFPTMHAAFSLNEIESADLLLLPGIRTKMNAAPVHKDTEVLDWIRAVHETTRWTTSVCGGSILLGAAGLLNGLKATGHWSTFDILPRFGASPTAERVVREGKIVTSAGVSAGIDMGLQIVAWECGDDYAKMVQLATEYDPKPPFDCGSPLKAPASLIEQTKLHFAASN